MGSVEVEMMNQWTWGQNNRIHPIWKIEKRLGKSDREPQGTCGLITKYPTFISLESKKAEEKEERMNKHLKKQWLKTCQIWWKHQHRDSRNSKQDKSQESMSIHIIIKLLKTKDKKPWKQPEKNNEVPVGKHHMNRFLMWIMKKRNVKIFF